MTTAQHMTNPHRAGTNQAMGAQETTTPKGNRMTTAYVPTGTEYADLAEALAEIGGHLERAFDFDSRECGWNSLDTCGRIEYRIHRAPAESSGYPSGEIEVGACCLIDAFRVARSEQDPNSSADLLVERRANGW